MKTRSWKPAVASRKGFVADPRRGQNSDWCKKLVLKTRCVWAAFWEVRRSNALSGVWGGSLCCKAQQLAGFPFCAALEGLREATIPPPKPPALGITNSS